jgi:predicted MFS family arabinose efflux permease
VSGAATDRSFRITFAGLLAVRLVGTVSLRFALPFIEDIADGLSVSITAIGFALAAGEVAGFAGPRLGRVLDRIGRRRGMELGLAASVAGCLIAGVAPVVGVLALGFFLIALGRFCYDISFTAWVSGAVPAHKRGRYLGLAETAWSGSLLVGVPLAGLLTALAGWRFPYLVLAALLFAAMPIVSRSLRDDTSADHNGAGDIAHAHARVRAVHVAMWSFTLAASFVFAVQGAWFERDLGLSTTAIAGAVFILGIGELAGALGSAALADRVGKRRTVGIGLAILAPMVLALALTGSSPTTGIAVAFLLGAGFELALVSSFPIVLEVPASRRAGAMGLAIMGMTVARSLASVGGPALFDAFGIRAPIMVAAPVLVAAGVAVSKITGFGAGPTIIDTESPSS